jgi:hypothetical protein
MQAPQQQRDAAHQIEKNDRGHPHQYARTAPIRAVGVMS